MSKLTSIKRIIRYPLTVCFVSVIIVLFSLYFVMPKKEVSEWENRYLATAPSLRISDILDGSYMSKYEEYINDQMPFRDGFIKLKAISEACLLKIENNGIAKGKDSYLFTKGKDDTSVFDKNLSIINEFSKGVSNKITVAIAPNACGVLKDKVPKGLLMVDQDLKLSEITADNSLLSGVRVLDLKSVLKAHEDEYIYYKTDHHWTTLGAYYAYREISENPVELTDIEESVSTAYQDDFLGTLYAKYKGVFVKPDVISYYDIKVQQYKTDGIERTGLLDTEKLSEFDKYGMFLYGNFGECDITSNANNGKKLIVFKDSYANCLIPFLTYDYENIVVIDLRYYKDSVKELISNNSDADILFINNFDFLNEDNHFYKLMK